MVSEATLRIVDFHLRHLIAENMPLGVELSLLWGNFSPSTYDGEVRLQIKI
jgi:hypothetical protein